MNEAPLLKVHKIFSQDVYHVCEGIHPINFLIAS